MVEEILVKEPLSKEMIDAGRVMLDALDAKGWRPPLAFWFYDIERNRWELTFASPEVDVTGRLPGIRLTSEILSRNRSLPLSPFDVAIVSTREKPAALLPPNPENIPPDAGYRIRNLISQGHYIDDAYVYRS